ncbi:invasion associated locus B family protein [Albidovulum sp.]|uniref:invasion associated locus B family protein n=1 Tax=Albidovulum sp. TaxID=1872424 RepID=UPI001D515200|nr:invasion associated locus B family protein [Paracoccaceae bacterium]
MPRPIRPLLLLLALAGALPAAAQDTTAPADGTAAPAAPADGTAAPADGTGAPAAAPADAAAAPADSDIGKPYVAETFDDWQLRCVRTADGSDPCDLFQLLKDKATDKPLAQITLISLPEGGDAAAGATIVVPLETLLTQQMNITIDAGQTKRYPFTFCADVGCVARVGFTKDDLAAFRKGKAAKISVVPVADPTRTVDVEVSLKGFTAGFEAVTKANAPKN